MAVKAGAGDDGDEDGIEIDVKWIWDEAVVVKDGFIFTIDDEDDVAGSSRLINMSSSSLYSCS